MSPHQQPDSASFGKTRPVVNRKNAANSTGPRTEEGKRRSSLNALRHGLTGQTVVLPEDDLAAYQKHCAQFHAELKPQGLLESKAVQTIADTYWRLDRIRAMENNLFSLRFHELSGELSSDDPAIHCALVQAKSLDGRGDLLARLRFYEQRLNRTLTLAKAELKQLQQERAEAKKDALLAAAQRTAPGMGPSGPSFRELRPRRAALCAESGEIRNLKQALNQPWDPQQDGFEFSNAELSLWMSRRQLAEEANDFKFHGWLPDSLSAGEALPEIVHQL